MTALPPTAVPVDTDGVAAATPTAGVPLGDALRFWTKLGFISFGGPAGQIALMHAELVQRRRWISEGRFLHALNYCMVLPGPEAQQLATYLGWLMHRTPGGIAAGALFVLPSLLILIALGVIYMTWGEQRWVAAVFAGIQPAVVAIVLLAAWRIGKRTLRHPALIAIAVAAFAALYVAEWPFPLILMGAAALGVLGGRLWPAAFSTSGGHAKAAAGAPAGPALIDDATPPPAHARPSAGRLATVILIGLALWAAPMGLLVGGQGLSGAYPQLGWFFTKAALLTFGGAYAVLPYVWQGAVQTHGWLAPQQMIDGLALGETTPGPLIMVVVFVGFVAGWQHPALLAPFGPEHALLSGTLAALWVAWVTFLPSFVFILAGGPWVEATRGQLALGAPLTAITAAVVGVIVNLGLHFAEHVFRPTAGGPLDTWAIAVTAAAAAALLWGRRGTLEVIAACAALGVLRAALG